MTGAPTRRAGIDPVVVALAFVVLCVVAYLVVTGDDDRSRTVGEGGSTTTTTERDPGEDAWTATTLTQEAEADEGGSGEALDPSAIPDRGAYGRVGRVVDLAELPGTADVVVVDVPDGASSGSLTRLARRNSALMPIWSTDLPGVGGTLHPGPEVVYAVTAASTGSVLTAVDAEDGRVRWTRDLGSSDRPCLGCGTVVGSDFVYSGRNGAVVRVGPDSGEPLWEHGPGYGLTSAEVAGGVALASQEGLAAGAPAHLEVMDVETGRSLPGVDLRCGETPEPSGEMLPFEAHAIPGSSDVFITWSRLHRCAARLAPGSERLVWSVDLGQEEGMIQPVYADDRVALVGGKRVWVVDLESGKAKAMDPVPTELTLPRWLDDEVVAEVISRTGQHLVRWDASTGAVVGDEPLSFSPAMPLSDDLAFMQASSAQNPGFVVLDASHTVSIVVQPDGPLAITDLEADPIGAPVAQADLPVVASFSFLLANRGGDGRVWVGWAGSVVGFQFGEEGAATWAAPA